MAIAPNMERNLAFELVRTTEAAALASARWMGRGNKEAADAAAVDAMRLALSAVDMDGIVVIGEGEKDEAPMLYIGERIGNGEPPEVDIAVDPIDGTRLLSLGLPNSISVVALSERGTLYAAPPGIVYMDKIVVGADARGVIDINAPVRTNLINVGKAKKKSIDDLTVVILDRPRHADLIDEVRNCGARIKLISDGDIAGALMTALPDVGVDMLMGVGGAPEAVVAACALKCLDGEIQCKIWPRNDEERRKALASGADLNQVLRTNDLARGDNVFFAATGITDGELLEGIKFHPRSATSESLVMRSRSGTVRTIRAIHNWDKLMRLTAIAYDTAVLRQEG